MLVTVFFCFNSNLLCIDKNFQNELWVLQSSPVIEQLVKTGRMHNKSFQRKRWGYSGEPVVTKCRLVVKCLRLPKDVKGGD